MSFRAILDSLFNFLVSGVGARVEDASGQVLDETNSLGNADLLLLSQLVSQTTLPGGGMIHWHWLGALLGKKEQKTKRASSMKRVYFFFLEILDIPSPVPFALEPHRYSY